MADETYNLSTDNLEKKEEPRLNPATGISSFASGEKKMFRGKYVTPVYVAGQAVGVKEVPQPKISEKQILSQVAAKMKTQQQVKKKPSQLKSIFGGYFGIRKKRPMKDQLKVMRLQNMLDKKRLQNQIQKMKLAKQIQSLRNRGILKQVISQPIIRVPQRTYPAYSNIVIQNDIDSMYADIGHGDASLWGTERYYNENFYNEDFYGNEFDTSPWEQLGIKPRSGISPLLW